jgi:UDP-perosamine 4-acetyltransferase
VINALQALDVSITGITDADPETHGKAILGVRVLGDDNAVYKQASNSVVLVNGVGSTNVSDRRRTICQKFLAAGYNFRSVVHPSAIISGEIDIFEGAQIMAGVVIQPGCRIGAQTIINTRSSVDHDCIIGAYTHIAPGAVLGGGITVGENCHVGAGVTVIQNIVIGSKVLVGAGATVISDIPDGSRVAGIPAGNM